MRFRAALLSACAFLLLTTIRGTAQCGPKMEKQVADVRSSWVRHWNEGQLGDVINLYYSDADLLAADGSRAHGQDEIRASLQKQIGSKIEVRSLAFACSDAFAYDNGIYTQTENGQSVNGNYLVVLFWKDGKWLIVQHASTAKR
jgi:uncharacterized protein (TIGR02246 family)